MIRAKPNLQKNRRTSSVKTTIGSSTTTPSPSAVIHHGNRITDQEESKVSSTAIDLDDQKQEDTDVEGNSKHATTTTSVVEPLGKQQEAKEAKENTPESDFQSEHYDFILNSVRKKGAVKIPWREIAEEFHSKFGTVVNLAEPKCYQIMFYAACKTIRKCISEHTHFFLISDFSIQPKESFTNYMVNEIRAGRFNLPKLAKTVMNRGDVDLDDYFQSKPLASDEELSTLANKIKVEYALLKNWYLGKHGKNSVAKFFLKQVAVRLSSDVPEAEKVQQAKRCPQLLKRIVCHYHVVAGGRIQRRRRRNLLRA